MYGVAFLRTGNLWLGLGVHIGWNWFQGTVLGFTVSGTDDYSGGAAAGPHDRSRTGSAAAPTARRAACCRWSGGW